MEDVFATRAMPAWCEMNVATNVNGGRLDGRPAGARTCVPRSDARNSLSEMTAAPSCQSLGRHCRELAVTLSVASLDDDDAAARDALATWLLGHRQRISFREPYWRGRRLVTDAVIHVPCKYLETAGDGDGQRGTAAPAMARCAAHGFVGPMPPTTQPAEPPPLQHEDGTHTVVHRGRSRRLTLPVRPAPRHALPVLSPPNPCVGAPCRTADNARGAACCRDLTLEILAPADQRRSDRLEALLLARRAPYLCKTERVNADIIECEVISSCGYLEDDGISCALHQRVRPDGVPAKPDVCSSWPDLGPEDVGHPGCRLIDAQVRRHGGTAGRQNGRTAARQAGRVAS